jgi:hypothetical protein
MSKEKDFRAARAANEARVALNKAISYLQECSIAVDIGADRRSVSVALTYAETARLWLERIE